MGLVESLRGILCTTDIVSPCMQENEKCRTLAFVPPWRERTKQNKTLQKSHKPKKNQSILNTNTRKVHKKLQSKCLKANYIC